MLQNRHEPFNLTVGTARPSESQSDICEVTAEDVRLKGEVSARAATGTQLL